VRKVIYRSIPSPGRDSNPDCHEHEASVVVTPSKSFSSLIAVIYVFPLSWLTAIRLLFITLPYKFLLDILVLILPLTFWIWYPVSRDSVVGIATAYGLLRGWISNSGRVKNLLFSTSSRPALGPTQSPIPWVPGPLSPGANREGREADHSPPTNSEVKKMWIYKSTPPHVFMT
jgi:hypothetical protein